MDSEDDHKNESIEYKDAQSILKDYVYVAFEIIYNIKIFLISI
jgi:hypothetical protein